MSFSSISFIFLFYQDTLGVVSVEKSFLDNTGIGGSLEVRFRCKDEHFSDMVLNKLDSDIKDFTSRIGKQFNNVSIDLDMRKMYIRVRGIPEYECRINLVTDKGSFYSSEIGIGAVQALNECFGNLQTQIFRKIGKMNSRIPSRGKDPYMLAEFEEKGFEDN